MQNGFVDSKKVMDGEARKGEARDEPAAPAPLGPQGPSGKVRLDSPMLQSSRRRDLVGVLPHGKGTRGGPAKKAKNVQDGILRECMPFGHHSLSEQLSLRNNSCHRRVTLPLEKARARVARAHSRLPLSSR